MNGSFLFQLGTRFGSSLSAWVGLTTGPTIPAPDPGLSTSRGDPSTYTNF